MTREEVESFETIRKYGITCRCADCDAFGCHDCVICQIDTDEVVELAKKLEEIAGRQ